MSKRKNRQNNEGSSVPSTPPAESPFARKQREQRLGLRPTVHDLQPEPAFREASQDKPKDKLSAPSKKEGNSMITDAYRRGVSVGFRTSQEIFPPTYNPGDLEKPCFLVASIQGGEWHVARYIGYVLPGGIFQGEKESKSVGKATLAVQKQIFHAMVDWASNQNQRYYIPGQKPLLDSAQKIYARRSPRSQEPHI